MTRFVRLAIVAGLLFFGATSARADSVTLTLLPSGGALTGTPDETVGWGYSLTNDSDYFLLWSSLDAGAFTSGTPKSLIFMPAPLGPHSTWTEGYAFNPDPSGWSSGFYEFTWDTSTAVGSVNAGTFVLKGDFYSPQDVFSGDDFGYEIDPNATPVGTWEARAGYSVTAVPEPATMGLLALGLTTLAARRTLRKKNR